MKKLFFILFILFFTNNYSQTKRIFGRDPIINLENWNEQRVFWGFFLGVNSYDFKMDYKEPDMEISVKSNRSFNVGLIGNLRLQKHIALRFEPALNYAQRDWTFQGFEKKKDYLREVKSTYIHLPLLVKFSSKRVGNVRPFLVGGFSTTLNMASNEKSKDDNLERRFRTKTWTQNYEVGFGIDVYTEYFVFSPSIRGVFGLKDELIRDKDPNSPWTGNVEGMRTRGVLVNFSFH